MRLSVLDLEALGRVRVESLSLQSHYDLPDAGQFGEAAHLTLSYAHEAANPLYRSDTASFFDRSLSCAVGAFSKAVERPPAPHRIDAA
jgi:hypothetical protein